MLKPYIRVIKTCILCFAICVIVAIAFDYIQFPHSNLLHDFAIGTACSLIVVVISSWVQYRVELKKVQTNCISATSKLLFQLALYDPDFNQAQIDYHNKVLEDAFNDFIKAKFEVEYFTKKANQKHSKHYRDLVLLYGDFMISQVKSPDKVAQAVSDKADIIRSINTFLNVWPDCYQKEHIKIVKNWLEDDGKANNNRSINPLSHNP